MPEVDFALRQTLTTELGRCRHRGIEGLDHVERNMSRIELPVLESLATRYSAVTAQHSASRTVQIKHLIRSALARYREEGRADDAELITDLFFGDSNDKAQLRSGELLDKAQKKWREPNESRFRERRRRAFEGFASYLLEFVSSSDDEARPARDPAGTDRPSADGEGLPYLASYRTLSADGRVLRTSPLTAVLRFSLEDPGGVAVTIEEHQRIIAENGACWWGWFKAAHDDDLRAEIAQRLGGGCEVALWERSEGMCYVARCAEVQVAASVDMQSPDPGLTPSYYRSKRWPAWFKLTAISPSSTGELVERFGDLPTAKSTIFWEQESDPEPVVIPARGTSILHLSGLRFGQSHRWSTATVRRPANITAQDAIDNVLDRHDIAAESIGVVMISGNFGSDQPTEAAYQESLAFIDGLCANLPNVERANITIVPGSDDFARPGDQARASQTLYREFHQHLYGPDAQNISRLRRYVFHDFHLNVLPVNTIKLLGTAEQDEGMFGHGYDGQLDVMSRDYRRSATAGRKVINVVTAHHHLISMLVELPVLVGDVSIKERESPGIHDGRGALERLAANHVRLFLHGHLHKPDFLFVSAADGWQTAVCGAGTAGAAEWWLREKYRDYHENSIVVYDVEEASIRGRAFSFRENSYRADPVKEFRISHQSEPLVAAK